MYGHSQSNSSSSAVSAEAGLAPARREWLPLLSGRLVAVLLRGSFRLRLSTNQLLLLAAAFLSIIHNSLFWHKVLGSMPAALGVREYIFLASIFLVLAIMLLSVLSLLSFGWLLRPYLTLVVMVAAISSYFMDAFRVVIDKTMIVNAAQTDVSEVLELLTPQLLAHLLLTGVLPVLAIWWVELRESSPIRELAQRLLLVTLALAATGFCVLAQYKSFAPWAREHRELRLYVNPVAPLYSVLSHMRQDWRAQRPQPLIVQGADARQLAAVTGQRPRIVLLVVGETARAANFQLNGYARETNPELATIDGLLNYPLVHPCGTTTAVSIPCIFFRGGQEAFSQDEFARHENLLDVVQRAGVQVLWRDNNSGCKGVCARVPSEDLNALADPQLCGPDGCFDEILLQGLPAQLNSTGRDQLIVLHQKGSHGPAYYKRHPQSFSRFLPECARDNLQECSEDEIVNAYDNTILYTDHVLAQLIHLLQEWDRDADVTLIYVSDHGESLGENGLYLHGMPYALAPDEQTHVPLLVWFSAGARAAQGLDANCIAATPRRPYSHDNLFDTVLGSLAVKTSLYRRSMDIFGACRSAS